jgi:uncharacterized protein YecT (DUF1311 family)
MRVITKYHCLFLLLFLLVKTAQAQSSQDIMRLEKEEKSCLDLAPRNVKCVTVFKHQMDSMLAVTYKAIQKKSNEKERSILEKEQKDWLQKQKIFDAETDNQYSLEVAEKDFSEMASMMALSEKADFVRDRVKELVKRSRSIKK